MFCSKNKEKGFTLIEIIISMGIFLALLLAIYVFQVNVLKSNKVIQSSLSVHQNAKKILRPFAEEIRSATISNTGAFAISRATTTMIEFYSDIDDDGLKEKVRYFLEDNSFKKGVIKPSGDPYVYDEEDEEIVSVVNNIVNNSEPIFEYFDENYNSTSSVDPLDYPIDVTDVTLVKATLLVDDDLNELPGPIEISTQATFRNLKDN